MLTKKHRFIVSGFPILILFIILIAATGTFYLNRAGDLFNGTYQHSFAVQISVEQANANLIAVHRAMKDVSFSKTPQDLEKALNDVDKNDKEFNDHINEIANIELDDKQLADVLTSYNDWASIRGQTIQYAISGEYGIADNILNKPDILSHEEWYEMRKHPEIGY